MGETAHDYLAHHLGDGGAQSRDPGLARQTSFCSEKSDGFRNEQGVTVGLAVQRCCQHGLWGHAGGEFDEAGDIGFAQAA